MKVIAESTAHLMQLLFEYHSAPLLSSSSPETAPEFAMKAVRGQVGQLAGDRFDDTRSKAA
ncbi:MAG: hypothetical protein AAGC55_01985 [Myxococcota bacterium]